MLDQLKTLVLVTDLRLSSTTGGGLKRGEMAELFGKVCLAISTAARLQDPKTPIL